VKNGGTPIPADQLSVIFEPFRKGDRTPAGLGLGLFIAREIARAHQGKLEVTSSREATTFSIHLPRQPPTLSGSGENRLTT
jgi:signal transduction histidine kinase